MTDHAAQLQNAASRFFGKALEALNDEERRALHHAKTRTVLSRGPDDDERAASFGEWLADRVARFGGSWTFIVVFALVLALWTIGNVWLLSRPFDPYPFIFLNLMLSMVAALQAPVIMMSQNRQSAKDRLNAAQDYAVNLKAEIEIMALHEKLDALRSEAVVAMLAKQQEQIELLSRLVAAREPGAGEGAATR